MTTRELTLVPLKLTMPHIPRDPLSAHRVSVVGTSEAIEARASIVQCVNVTVSSCGVWLSLPKSLLPPCAVHQGVMGGIPKWTWR